MLQGWLLFGSMKQWDPLPSFVTMLLQIYLKARQSSRILYIQRRLQHTVNRSKPEGALADGGDLPNHAVVRAAPAPAAAAVTAPAGAVATARGTATATIKARGGLRPKRATDAR